MARQINKLTVAKVSSLKKRGFHADGGGLYLQVAPGGSKSWVFRYRQNGRLRDMGLGSVITINLAEARDKALACRKLRLEGLDPIEERNKQRTARQLEAARLMTFNQCRDAFLADQTVQWSNAKHRQQWRNTLETYVSPVFGSLPVQDITTDLVLKVLRPIWTAKPETASRVRGRIEKVLSWATTSHFRTGDNPARWAGHLSNILAPRSKVRKVKHHAALPYADLPAFMADLKSREGVSARALEFTILTAARTGETTRAEWSEFYLDEKLWIVPAARMKAKRAHRVPLSDAAIAVLRDMQAIRRNKFVFVGERSNRPLSDMSLLMVLRRMGRDVTAHGFRSTFKDWARERTSFPNEVSEAALAHVIGDKTEAAYARGDLFNKRRRLMEAWADYASKPGTAGEVVPMRSAS